MTTVLPIPSPILDEELMIARWVYSADVMLCGHALVLGERYLLIVQAPPHPHVRLCSRCTIRSWNGTLELAERHDS
jgi:hypothetical protein